MTIKKPSVITLSSGQKWILINAKRINDRDFGLLAEIPQEGKTSLLVDVAEMRIVDGQAYIAFYTAPDSTQIFNMLIKM